jgi:hypothetical protein
MPASINQFRVWQFVNNTSASPLIEHSHYHSHLALRLAPNLNPTFTEHGQSTLSHRCAHRGRDTRSKQDVYLSGPCSTSSAAACPPNSTLSKPDVNPASTTAGMSAYRRSGVTKAPLVSSHQRDAPNTTNSTQSSRSLYSTRPKHG